MAERAVQPGDDVTVSGTLRLYTPDAAQAPSQVSGNLHFGVDLLFDAQGVQTAASSNFVSSLLTPTGLAIERNRSALFDTLQVSAITLVAENGALAGSVDTSVLISDSLPAGTYRLCAWLPSNPDLDSLGTKLEQGPNILIAHQGATVALLTVGSPDPPRLSPMLLVDNPSQGTRGAIALEDEGSYEFANRVATQSSAFVVEPRDRADGEPITYRLEPFFPFLSLADRNLPSAPVVPLDVPGGDLTVTVTTPSGSVEALGSLPILQTRTGQRATAGGIVLDSGGGNPGDVLQLTTLSDDFAYQFTEYGCYTISVSGSVPDVWGQAYRIGGTFEVCAAETLDIETASLPSTPFEAGDQLPAVVNVYPGVPADIEMGLELYPIDGSPPLTDSVIGTATRFGYFDGAGKAFELSEAGESLVRVQPATQPPFGVGGWGPGDGAVG